MVIAQTSRQSLVSIMEHGLQLRQEINSIREQFKGILDAGVLTPTHSNSTPRAPGCVTPRTPLQPLLNPTPRSRGPRMGCSLPANVNTKESDDSNNNNNNGSNKMAPPNALVALQNYLKNRTPVKRRLSSNDSPSGKIARLSNSYEDKENIINKSDTPSTKSRRSLRKFSVGSRDSLKKLLSPKRRSVVRTVRRSPILTNGILIRNKEGELINPPVNTNKDLSSARKRLIVDPQSELPQSPCTLGPRSCGDGQELKPAKSGSSITKSSTRGDRTVELSASNYTKSPDTFYVIDRLKEKTLDTSYNSPMHSTKWRVNTGVNGCIQQAVQKIIPDKTYMSETKQTDKTIGELSMISRLGEGTIREQPSALMNTSGPVADVLHSTLNYPLHSTMYLDALSSNNNISQVDEEEEEECDDSSVISFCVDETPFQSPPSASASLRTRAQGDCDVCKVLKRQTGQGRLQHPRKAVALSESDFLFERSCLHDSLNATRGTDVNLSEVQESTLLAGSSLDQTTVRDLTLCNNHHSHHLSNKRKSVGSNSSQRRMKSEKSKSRRVSHASDKSKSISKHTIIDSDSDKENSNNPSITQSKHLSDATSSFSSSLSQEKKRQLKRRLKKFNSKVHSKSNTLDIKTLGFF